MDIAQAFAHLGVSAQGVNATVYVYGCVVFHGAAVGSGDVVIRVTVGLQHFGCSTEHGCTLRIGEGAQGCATVAAGKGKGSGQVKACCIYAN